MSICIVVKLLNNAYTEMFYVNKIQIHFNICNVFGGIFEATYRGLHGASPSYLKQLYLFIPTFLPSGDRKWLTTLSSPFYPCNNPVT